MRRQRRSPHRKQSVEKSADAHDLLAGIGQGAWQRGMAEYCPVNRTSRAWLLLAHHHGPLTGSDGRPAHSSRAGRRSPTRRFCHLRPQRERSSAYPPGAVRPGGCGSRAGFSWLGLGAVATVAGSPAKPRVPGGALAASDVTAGGEGCNWDMSPEARARARISNPHPVRLRTQEGLSGYRWFCRSLAGARRHPGRELSGPAKRRSAGLCGG
jgi:hypothetical protein